MQVDTITKNNNINNFFQQHLRVQQHSTRSRRTTRTVIKKTTQTILRLKAKTTWTNRV